MSFKDIYNALYNQLSTDSTLTSYIQSTQFLKGFKDPLPQQEYTLILEPGEEEEKDNKQSYTGIKEFIYNIDIYARVMLFGVKLEGTIVGTSTKKGVLEFVDDIKSAIRSDITLGYDRQGSSVSAENSSDTFALTASNKYLTISMDGRTPTGYDTIDCGSTTLSGNDVATNIQASLRALGNHGDDGYYEATCTYSSTTKKFTITSPLYSVKSKVTVTAGSSNDCSALLGFDDPTELTGRNEISIHFKPVYTDNRLYPVRYRVLPITITEEVLIK